MISVALAAALGGYQVAPQGGRWSFVAPDGSRFLSNGVCCVNRGIKREEWKSENPGYSSVRLYPSDGAWARSTARTLKDFGFNTVGAWSDHELLHQSGLYQTPVLHLSQAGIPWVDPWSDKAIKEARAAAVRQIGEWKKLPKVIGYFSDNELGWWFGALFEWTWKGGSDSPGRQKAVDHFESKYKTWERLTADFEPQGASSFAELRLGGRLFLRAGREGAPVVKSWLAKVADRYYSLSRELIKEQDPKALILGDRYISNYYPEVARAAGPYVDVLSTNLNADWKSGTFAPFFLKGLRETAKKPILITEYYSAAMVNQSGNMNDSSGFPTLNTQQERVESFRKQTEFLLNQPDIVGVHWFQYYDEPRHGRGDGENYNFGLLDILGQPYKRLRSASRKSLRTPNKRRYDASNPRKRIPYVSPIAGRSLETWPIWDSAMPRVSGEPRGDLYVAWNGSGLYGAFYWSEDRFFEAFYSNGVVPQADEPEFELIVNGERLVKGSLSTTRGVQLEGANVLESKGGVRSWVLFRIHASRMKRAELRPGLRVKVEGKLKTRGRFYSLRWAADQALETQRGGS